MAKKAKISAMLSHDIKERLDRLVRTTGVKRAHVFEMALKHHLQVLFELPPSFVIPPRLVVTRSSGDELVRRLRSSLRASKQLANLMAAKRR